MRPIVRCTICGSEKFHRETCSGCGDLAPEQWWIAKHKRRYVVGEIESVEFEALVASVLRQSAEGSLPRPSYRTIRMM